MNPHTHPEHGHHSAGSSIYIISPSGRLAHASELDLACQRLNDLGFNTQVDSGALAGYQRFAGTDAQRLAAIQRSLNQPHSIVLASRGGYGLSRLLHQINWQAIADSGKRFVGHSDFTAFNLALLAQTGCISYCGPAAVPDFAGKELDDLTPHLFAELMRNELEILSFESPEADAIDTRGILWGGNLAMLVSLLGTPYMPHVPNGILFIEDVGEHPYRIERMLIQLWHSGVLAQQQAIILGQFTQYRLNSAIDNGFDLASVIQWLRNTVKTPVIPGLPYGHVPTKATLPVGQKIGLATEDGMAYLVLHEHH